MPTTQSIVLGPREIADISQAVEDLMPWLARSEFRMLPSGNLEFTEAEPAEAVRALRGAVEVVLPIDVRTVLGQRSGLGWNIFFGHVVTWWLPQRRRMGFLRALVDRASLHDLRLELHWNEGRYVKPAEAPPGDEALLWGGGLGIALAFFAQRIWPYDSVPTILSFALGLVVGRLYQRVGKRRSCGDPLCRNPVGRRSSCPSCGALTRVAQPA